MLCLPECFSYVGEKWQDTVAAGQSIEMENGVIAEMRAQAAENDIWLSLGGFPEIAAEDEEKKEDSSSSSHDRVYNTHLIVDNKGLISAIYRKIHLFDVVSIYTTKEGEEERSLKPRSYLSPLQEIPNGPVMLESRYTAPGSKITMMPNSPIGNLGLTTCYDLRFPEIYIELVNRGAQVREKKTNNMTWDSFAKEKKKGIKVKSALL